MFESLRLVFMAVLAGLLVTGCAIVQEGSMSSKEYVSSRRGDVLTTGQLSSASKSALQVVGLDEALCLKQAQRCRNTVLNAQGLSDEQRLSSLSELWILDALKKEEEQKLSPADEAIRVETLNAHLESARYAFAYLFFTSRKPDLRAMEERQAQVRDYYNFASQQAVVGLFQRYKTELQQAAPSGNVDALRFENWRLHSKSPGLSHGAPHAFPHALIAASSLRFGGLRNQYRRDGLGAELVAVYSERVVNRDNANTAWSETPFPSLTTLLLFEGDSLDEVLNTNQVQFLSLNPHKTDSLTIEDVNVPLAANFTAGYGLWLARSGFAQQSLLTLIGQGEALDKPRIYLMQPYNPNQRVVLMLHGLASSPEAWVNVANELQGDTEIRDNYQIWQVYYPTNLPIAFNHQAIRKALTSTLEHFDPQGQHLASNNMVVGHSMGGILARLMVSNANKDLLNAFLSSARQPATREARLREQLEPLLAFEAMPNIQRAVFVATPHLGTHFADNGFARFVSGLIKLPANVLGRISEIAQLMVDPQSAAPNTLTRSFNSINNLSNQDPFIQRTAQLPIPPQVKLHSIIGNDTPDLPVENSHDGLVPYTSSHLPNAQSELVLESWHSVQEHPKSIVEIRRILREHLVAP